MAVDSALETELAGWGKVLLIETRGRISGRRARAAVGFVEADDTFLVAAGNPNADWALNLESDPRCTVTTSGTTFAAIAEPLDDGARNAAIRGLILKYGTPAERLGRGPAFRLRPAPPEAAR